MEIRHSNIILLYLGSNLHCLIPIKFLIIILSITLVMEIRHSLQTHRFIEGSNLHCLDLPSSSQ